ncbi:8-oxo-dGTP diphosphatase MutT [Hirschia baltica]|uniref:8-oxo-dGTP diphosphatase n=1 Tax=Hirschia baltica (strain ATCC 49814 / DSM 5838 / IFAM 1418) TaxID=582402 RepID=C6XPX3_HIRBI|nr:8-oxo-dGTP diphosphatase MutT [Hirschia baltica]ACT58490.1 mutator MutT protein [Hirschia baltica ATCC 49814]
MTDKKLVLVSAVALVDQEDRLLLAQRPEGKSLAGLWEFPGGKVEEGENPEAALVRELKEELGIKVDERDFLPFTFASHAYKDFHLLMPVYLCQTWEGEPEGCEGQDLAWVSVDELAKYPTPPADVRLMDDYRRWIGSRKCGE